MFGQVMNRVAKSQTLVINGVRVCGSGLHTPTRPFWEYALGTMSVSYTHSDAADE